MLIYLLGHFYYLPLKKMKTLNFIGTWCIFFSIIILIFPSISLFLKFTIVGVFDCSIRSIKIN